MSILHSLTPFRAVTLGVGLLLASATHTALASQPTSKHDLEHVVVTNDPAYFVAQKVGTKGLGEFDTSKHYAIVLSPGLDPSNSTGVRIPNDFWSAVAELKLTLPSWYKTSLHTDVVRDQNHEPFINCESTDAQVDRLVADWILVYWKLRDPSSSLMSFYHEHIAHGTAPEGVVSDVMVYLCRDLYAERLSRGR